MYKISHFGAATQFKTDGILPNWITIVKARK